MKYTLIKQSILFFCSVLFIIGSVFVMVPVKNRESLSAFAFGYPIGFVTQDFSGDYGENGWYPPNQFFRTERPFSILWWRGLGSLLTVWGILSGGIWLLERMSVPHALRSFLIRVRLKREEKREL